MRYDVELIVGATAKELQLASIAPVNGIDLSNYPLPWAYWTSSPEVWTIGSVIYIVTTSDPATWTVLGTITVVGVDPIANTFTYTTDFTPDPDTIYTTAFYSNTVVSSSAVLDLYENEVISQNWRFSDLQTFEALGSFSRQFRVPASKRNLAALGYLPDANFKADEIGRAHV